MMTISGWLATIGRWMRIIAVAAAPVTTPSVALFAAEPEYVGSKACGVCHAEQVSAWTGSHHDWALKPPEAPWMLGDFSGIEFEYKGKTARFLKEGDSYVVDLEEPGAPPRRWPIAWVVGKEPLQQYLVETEPGRLQALDLAWDTEAKRWFDLYLDQPLPPDDGLHWSGPYKTWNSRCADCHHTAFRKGWDPGSKTYRSTWSEPAVTCEACHGPGSAHIEAVTGGTSWPSPPIGPSTRSNLLPQSPPSRSNPSGLSIGFDEKHPEVEIERCAECHARRDDLTGQSPLPGTPFADAFRLTRLTPGTYFPDGQDREEVYVLGAFLQSRMHAAGVRCTDCHDPHTAKLKAEGNAVCTRCHSEAGNPAFPSLKPALYDDPSHHHHPEGSEGAACAACHMPVRTYMQVDPRRDHGFRVPRPDISGPAGAPDACTSCHEGKDWQWAAATIAGWFPDGRQGTPHFGTLFAEADGAGPASRDVIDRLAAYATDLAHPAIVRASAIDRIDAPTGADLDRIRPLLADPDPIVRGAAIVLHQGAPAPLRAERIGPLLADPMRSVRIDAARTLFDVPPEAFPADLVPAMQTAMGEFQASLVAGSDAPETQMAIGGVALAMRSAPAAAAAFREAADLDPGLVEAWRMAARIAWATGDVDLARSTVDDALAANPGAAPLLVVKAGLLRAGGDRAGAADAYRTALVSTPDDVGLAIEFGDFLASGGSHAEALDVLTPMLGREPGNPDLLFLIARSAVAAGRAPVARAAIAAFRRTNAGHPLEPEIERLAAGLP
jgi:predicted CXXCH cytochrome family protein